MSLRSRWWIVALVATGLLIGLSFPLARQLSGLPLLVGPVAVLALLAAAAWLGAQRALRASLVARLRNGFVWAVFAAAVVMLPGAMQLALFWWESYGLPRPPDARFIPQSVATGWNGRQLAWKTKYSREEVETFYVERLPKRGWRLEWSEGAALPANATTASFRNLLFRRFDGWLIVTIMVDVDETIVATRYSQLDDSIQIPKTAATGPAPKQRTTGDVEQR